MDACEIDLRFTSYKFNPEGLKKVAAISEAFQTLLIELNKHCPEGQDYDKTKNLLEEACMFAKKAMAKRASNQDQSTRKVGENESVTVSS